MRISANQSVPEGEESGLGLAVCAEDHGDGSVVAGGVSRAGDGPAREPGIAGASGDSRKSPSNRRDLPPSNGVDDPPQLGIDRISVSFRVEDFDANPDHWDSYSVRHTQKAPSPWLIYEELHPPDGGRVGTIMESHRRNFEFANGGKVFAGVLSFVSESRTSTVGKLEFNPARFANPSGFRLASVEDTFAALLEVVRGVDSSVVPMFGDELKSYKIKRIDVAKDFRSVSSPSALLRGLASIPRKHARKNYLHADPLHGGAQTLTVGSKAGLVRLYDKFVETNGSVAPGTMRWEVQAREAWAKRIGGLSTMADVCEESIARLAFERWSWSSMGAEVVAFMDVQEIARRLSIKEAEASTYWGWVVDHGISSGWSPSPTTEAKYRRYSRELGVAFGLEAFLSNSCAVRLDWDSGSEVLVPIEAV